MKSLLNYKYKTDLPLTPDNRINFKAILLEKAYGSDIFRMVPEDEEKKEPVSGEPEQVQMNFDNN